MDITDRVGHVKDQVRQHRLEDRLDRVERENLRLKTESRTLRDELQDDRRQIAKRLSAIQRVAAPRRHRLRRLVTLATFVGGSYVLGAKAGRERYEELRAALGRATGKIRDTADDLGSRASEAVDGAAVVSDRLTDAGQVIGGTARSLVEGRVDAREGL